MDSPIENEKFKQGLIQDLADAQSMNQQTAQGMGKIEEDHTFEPRAVRIKGKAVAENELADTRKAINKTVEDLVSQSGITDEIEEGKFRIGLQRKLNKYRMSAIQHALILEKEMKVRGLNQEKQQALINAFAGIAEGTAHAAISGFHDKKKLSALTGGEDVETPSPGGGYAGANTAVEMGTE
jgi:hypothetical protein